MACRESQPRRSAAGFRRVRDVLTELPRPSPLPSPLPSPARSERDSTPCRGEWAPWRAAGRPRVRQAPSTPSTSLPDWH
ncbi:hypothetical protein ACFFX0_06245 [Citricoccus parietis]|uniref:Uncharacterized protein n=1 Tax=Citricoccus parietis TaxID=592307 RepID=A0ABV5FVW1_9MICC